MYNRHFHFVTEFFPQNDKEVHGGIFLSMFCFMSLWKICFKEFSLYIIQMNAWMNCLCLKFFQNQNVTVKLLLYVALITTWSHHLLSLCDLTGNQRWMSRWRFVWSSQAVLCSKETEDRGLSLWYCMWNCTLC